jgi:23S rRNA (pseudouridine1915-N3)-methyltransferase
MYRIKVHLVGKTKELWLQQAEKEYLKRLSSTIHLESVIYRSQEKMEQALASCKGLVLLDPQGTCYRSETLAAFLEKRLQEGGSRLELAIGGAEGFSSGFRENFSKISLSALTFTHQICRLVLFEQLYRCSEIWKGSGYHK